MNRPAIHPGEIVQEELSARRVSAADAVSQMGLPRHQLTQILSGERAITADTALRLGYCLGTGPELWLNLQRQYERRTAAIPEERR